jgi:hypothetical protein
MRHFKDHESHVYLYLGSIAAALLMGPGCATTENVRYVYQDRDFGVIGMPANTDEWPTHYRRQAEKLMEEHFPEGHEIVRAEEVVEGSRLLKIEGSKTAEIAPQLPTELLKVARLGGSASRSQADTLKIKECRIIYRRIPRVETSHTEDRGPVKARIRAGSRLARTEAADFADQAAVTPGQYLDPNDAERRKARNDASVTQTAQHETEQKHVVAKPVAEPPAAVK